MANPSERPDGVRAEHTAEPLLSPADRLLLHQLKTLEWLESREAPGETRGEGRLAAEDAAPPERWHLTGDLALYPWQQDCVAKWLQAEGRGTVKVVTGAGKTLLALAIAERVQSTIEKDLRVAIVVPTVVLMNQWFDELREKGNLPASALCRLGGGHSKAPVEGTRVLIAVLATAYKQLPPIARQLRWGDKLLLVVDECHRAGATEMRKVLETPRRWSLGLSATPERESDDDDAPAEDYNASLLGREIGPMVYELTLAEAVKLNVVPPFTVCHYGLPLSAGEREKYDRLSRSIKDAQSELRHIAPRGKASGAAFFAWVRASATRSQGSAGSMASRLVAETRRRKELLYSMQSRAQAVEGLLRDELARQPGARAILFHESIDEVMRLFKRLRAAGFAAVAEHSELPAGLRESSLELFRAGVAQVIVSARSLIEGFNVPAADVGIVVASSSSVRQRIQSLGRLLRRHRTERGEEKSSVIHVLYAHGTVDDQIYARVDWSGFTGLEANRYFVWDVEDAPVAQEGPPRTPLPRDYEVEGNQLKPGSEYPGRYEGEELSCDHMGNVTDEQGRRATNPGDLPKQVRRTKGNVGRFRVTPRRNYVLVRVPSGDDWVTLYVGQLDAALVFSDRAAPQVVSKEEAAAFSQAAEPGSRYPFPGRPARESLVFKQKRGGVIARRTGRGEEFARVGTDARASRQGEDAERLLHALRTLRSRGIAVTRFEVNDLGHAVYHTAGQTCFLAAIEAGLEFPLGAEGDP